MATEVLAQFPEAADGIGQFPQVLLCFDPQEVAQHLNKLLEWQVGTVHRLISTHITINATCINIIELRNI